jgi:PAS domain S-box-containing protein
VTLPSKSSFGPSMNRLSEADVSPAWPSAEEQYRSIFENAVFGAFQTSPDGRFITANDALARILGFGSSQELVESVTDIAQQVHVDPLRREEFSHALQESGAVHNFEAQAYRQDGSIIWLSLSARAIRDAAGNIARYEGIVEDVTARKRTELELVEMGNRLNATYTLAAVGISVIDMTGRFIAVNDRLCEITGYSREELLTYRFQDITHPDDVKPDADLFARLKAGEIETYQLEKRYVHKNRSTIWIELNVSLVRDAAGKPAYRIGVVQDITARKRAEQEAEAAQRRLSFLAEASAILTSSLEYEKTLDNLARLVVTGLGDLCSIDMVDDGLVKRVALAHADRAKEKAFLRREPTYTPDPKSGHPVLRVTASGCSELINNVSDAALKSSARDAKHLKALRALGVRSAMVVPLTAGPRSLGAMTIVSAESGRRYEQADLALAEELARRAALAIENASLYEAEQTARAAAESAQQRLWFLAEANAVLSSSLDLETTLSRVAGLAVPWLADCCSVHMFPADGVEPRSAVTHVDPAKEELVRELHTRYPPTLGEHHPIIEMMQSQTPILVEEIQDADLADFVRDEAHRDILHRLDFKSYMVVPLIARGRLFGAMTFATSAVERRYGQDDLSLAEELARRAALALDNARLYDEAQRVQDALRVALEAKDEFLGVMSHELRTPITAVYGGTRVLRSRGERLDDESKARLLEDIEQESERLFRMVENLLVLSRLELGQQVATEPVLAQRVIGKLASSFKQRRLGRSLELKIDERMQPVAAEPHYLEHVLRNLLTNADKYSPSDSPIEIQASMQGDEAEIVILDRGPGIAQEETEAIFERFYRSDRTSGQAAGIGLGLTVCKRLMEAQAGRVWARPREGGGLAAGITLPVYKEVQRDI